MSYYEIQCQGTSQNAAYQSKNAYVTQCPSNLASTCAGMMNFDTSNAPSSINGTCKKLLWVCPAGQSFDPNTGNCQPNSN